MESGMCSCDYEPWEWSSIVMPKARKEHTCCECGEPIKPGEVYEYATGSYDGQIDHYKTCVPCTRIRRDFCCGIMGLREALWEALGYDYVTGESAYEDEEEEEDDD